MKTQPIPELDVEALSEPVQHDFGLRRRSFVQIISAGLLIAAGGPSALAQRGGRRGGFGGSGAKSIGARILIGKDGSITLLAGKVEAGQGAREELIQAAAEELRVSPESIQAVLADTSQVPNDGITAGSGTSPRTVPSVRQGATAARQLLVEFAAKRWSVDSQTCEVRDGKAIHAATKRTFSYAELANSDEAAKAFAQPIPADIVLTPVKEWKALGKSLPRPNGRDIVTGAHKYPSDISRPGMLYGRILRAPSFGAKLTDIDLAPAKEMKGVFAVRNDQFVGVAAPTMSAADQALAAISKTAKWETSPQPSSSELFSYLREHVQGGMPENPFAEQLAGAKRKLRQTYQVAYAQHSPLEPRAAVAEWSEGKVTVWAGTQSPFGHQSELARAFHLSEDNVRVVVPDFGAAFGGKHTGEASVEAARLAQAAGKPVSLRWTREEEFTWAYFRPAALIDAEASLDAKGVLTSWHFINVNSGPSAVETPYRVDKRNCKYVQSAPPLRHGSYRALAATANNFARECFMDELAAAAEVDPLEFRLANLDNPRLRAVLEAAAKSFGWQARMKQKHPGTGIGLACGTEKGSFVAACVEIETGKGIRVKRVSQAFECGAILNPDNLRKQVQGAIIMGLGPALREEVRFENGAVLTTSFGKYQVPRFEDVPELDVHLLDRLDLASAGAGETPIIAVAPAIANAVFHATGSRVRTMPIRIAPPA